MKIKLVSDLHLECLLKLGLWKLKLIDPGAIVDMNTRKEVLAIFANATLVNANSYRAWHEWGMSNLNAILESHSIARMNNHTHQHIGSGGGSGGGAGSGSAGAPTGAGTGAGVPVKDGTGVPRSMQGR